MMRQEWVGRRVVARHVSGRTVTGEVAFADVVGDLLRLDSQRATIEASSGVVDVELSAVAVSRLVEPSTADILALEAICARGWQPAESHALGGWLLRANSGFTGRANSVLPLRQPLRPVPEALDAATAWYGARQLPVLLQVPLPARTLLDNELGERGFAPFGADNQVLVARLDHVRGGDDTPHAATVTVPAEPGADWLGGYHYRGRPLPEAARATLVRHERVAFAGVRSGGRMIAIGRGVVDDGWLGVTAVEVDPQHRRRGHARTIMRALWDWGARTHGARRSYLQVSGANEPAGALYAGLGYWRHHDYRYRIEPDPRG